MSVSALEPSRPRRSWLAWALWLALSAALLVAIRHLAWEETFRRLSDVRLPWIAAAVAANFAILPMWALEWGLLVPTAFRVAYARMFEIVSITASVLNSIPFFAGEASAVGLLIARADLSRSAAASVLALDQLLVAFAKLVVLALAASLVPLPGWLRTGVFSLALGFIILLVILLVLAHFWTQAHELLSRRTGRVPTLLALATTWGRHLDALREKRRAVAAIALALLKKGAEISAVVAIQLAFGIEPSVAAAVLVVACLAITTLIPIAPANLGVYEATVFAAYRYMDVPADAALGMALLQHVCFLIPSIATGYTMATLAQLKKRPRPTHA
ncbi:MAG: lysylphosphatidylglycerol synthase transmembrane domain-containing protein [Gemmatimonadaceae bacterium]